MVPAVEEAVFFHSVARTAQPRFIVKGNHPLTESYSILGPEFLADTRAEVIESRGTSFVETLSRLDMLVVAGQAKSHCLAWTVEDLLVTKCFPASSIYLLEDCTSPVVVPGLVDYAEEAAVAFRSFEKRGLHLVKSTVPLETWPGVNL